MKWATILISLAGIISLSGFFIVLIAVGGVSQAVVKGATDSFWSSPLYQLWKYYLVPYILYVVVFFKDFRNPVKSRLAYKSILYSVWLSFPGILVAFLAVIFKNYTVATVVPVIQIMITSLSYFLSSDGNE